MATALRPLTLGELLDRVFQLYRAHFILFVGIAALPNGVLLAFELATLAEKRNPFSLVWLVAVLVTLLLSFVGGAVAQAATVHAVSQLYLGSRASITGTFLAIRSRVLPLLVAVLVVGIMVGLGMLALLLPGLYLLLRWALVVPSVVIERKSLGGAMGRSAELMKAQYGRVLLIYVLFVVLMMIFASIFQIPAVIATISAGIDGVMPVWAEILVLLGQFLGSSVIGPLFTIAISLVYYDARVRREAFDLDHMVAQLETAPTPSPAAL